MSDPTTPIALSPYAYLAEGYLILLRALRRDVKQRLSDGESGDGWWDGPVREVLERQKGRSHMGKKGQQQSRSRWDQIADLRKSKPEADGPRVNERRLPEDFLDPSDLLLLVEKLHTRLFPEVGVKPRFHADLIRLVIPWRNQSFAHPESEPPSAMEVVQFLHIARTLLVGFGLPEEAQIKAISDAVTANASSEQRNDPVAHHGGAPDSLEGNPERTVAAVVNGLKLYGDGDSVRLPIARSYANYFLGASDGAPIPQGDDDLLSLIEKDERVKAERSAEGTVWVRLSDSATSTEPQPLPRKASTSTPPIHDDASPMAEEWIPRGIETIREVRLPNGWAPIRWCEHVLTSRYGILPGAEADTGAVGAFFERHPDHFEVFGRAPSGRVRLRERSRALFSGGHISKDEAVKATDIRTAIDECADNEGWATVFAVGAHLMEITTVPNGFHLLSWLQHDRSGLFELRRLDTKKVDEVRFTGQVEEDDGTQPRTTETGEVNTDNVSDRPSKDTATSTPTAAQPQAAAGGSVGQPVHQDEGSAQAPYPEWADIVARAIEGCSDRSDGWAKVSAVRFRISERRRSFEPSAYGFTTLRNLLPNVHGFTTLSNLLASREDLFEVRYGRTGDSADPDLVRIRARSEPIDANYRGSVGQKAGPSQERDPDWPDWADLIAQAMESSGLHDGWASLGNVGNYVKRLQPGFEPQAHGFPKLRDLIESRDDLFEIQDRRPPGVTAAALWIRIRAGGHAETE